MSRMELLKKEENRQVLETILEKVAEAYGADTFMLVLGETDGVVVTVGSGNKDLIGSALVKLLDQLGVAEVIHLDEPEGEVTLQ